jgi:asparagine synthase (glutamine-hydrolysing)
MSAGEWAEALRAKLEESVRIHLRSDVPVGAWLSAGIDSSAVVSLMSRFTNDPVETFTLAFEHPGFDEVRRQKILKDFDGYNLSNRQSVFTVRHFDLIPKAVWHCEDPVALGTGMSRMVLSQLASENVKVVLTGEGSDEVFGSYPWFETCKLLEPLSKLPSGIRRLIARIPAVRKRWRRAMGILGAPAEMNLNRYKIIINSGHEKLLIGSGSAEIDESIFSDELRQEPVKQECMEDSLVLPLGFDKWHPFSQLQYFEIKVRLSDFITRQLDLASMAYSLEVRVPFLDHELVEFCAQIPPGLKMRGLQEKYILRRAMRNDLPPEIVRRKKRGMTSPFVKWTRNLPEFAMELLSESQIREKGYFNPKFVTQILEQNRSGKANYGRSLMGVLGVQLWDDLFRKGCRPIQQ